MTELAPLCFCNIKFFFNVGDKSVIICMAVIYFWSEPVNSFLKNESMVKILVIKCPKDAKGLKDGRRSKRWELLEKIISIDQYLTKVNYKLFKFDRNFNLTDIVVTFKYCTYITMGYYLNYDIQYCNMDYLPWISTVCTQNIVLVQIIELLRNQPIIDYPNIQ